MKGLVSVVVCTHNPRQDYLEASLESLRRQNLPGDCWELILVDNASREPLEQTWDLSWHRNGRIVREDELGLTAARLRGIREASGELLIFVDDDNILAEDYLDVARGLSARHHHIGAFGGSIKGRFEAQPPEWSIPYLSGLALEEIDRDYWSNVLDWSKAVPYGAGLCVRRSVAQDYANKVMADPRRRALDRKGLGLGAGGDTDLAWCAVDLGMGTARFRDLKMTHLISKGRLTEEYLGRLYGEFEGAHLILSAIRMSGKLTRQSAWSEARTMLRRLPLANAITRRILYASWQSRREANRVLACAETHPANQALAVAKKSYD